ncbi:hypothetical protein [Hyperthermus butylicus]|uniref:hypothetical protein n=1 Tax=Hyperthermus butylicus TaxID=54248 RepID=UPI00129A0ED4|nr:hypothetical protein [Hyperthermus butylicus]
MLGVAAVFLWVYVWLMTGSGMLPGIDGPYYAAQVLSIDRYGVLRHPDPLLVFYVMYFFYVLLGDLFRAVAVGASVLLVLASVLVSLFVRGMTASGLAGLAAMIVFLAPPFELRLIGDFLKNAAGLVWVAALLLVSYMALRGGGRRSRLRFFVASLAVFVGGGLTHILDYGFMLVLVFALFLLQLVFDRGNIFYEGVVAAVLSLALFYAFPGLQGGDLFKAMGFVEEAFASFDAAPGPVGPQPGVPAAAPLLPRILVSLNLLSIVLLFAEGLLSGSREARYVLAALALALALLVLPV